MFWVFLLRPRIAGLNEGKTHLSHLVEVKGWVYHSLRRRFLPHRRWCSTHGWEWSPWDAARTSQDWLGAAAVLASAAAPRRPGKIGTAFLGSKPPSSPKTPACTHGIEIVLAAAEEVYEKEEEDPEILSSHERLRFWSARAPRNVWLLMLLLPPPFPPANSSQAEPMELNEDAVSLEAEAGRVAAVGTGEPGGV